MIEKVINTIKCNNMFEVNDKVVVALSGGPDSICLLHILHTLKDEINISIVAAHVNHCLRGEAADNDEMYVKKICEELGIQCFVKREDVHRISKERGISCEMAGREVRYQFFEEVLHKINGNKIAIAHNANDQAETVLMRILRGTGLEGLVGIRPVRDNIFVRPIINLTRDEIENYCDINKLNPRIDKTNFENIYTRNKIRLELIPYIQKNFNSDVIEVLNRFSDTVKVDNEYINNVAKEKYNEYSEISEEKIILKGQLFKEHEAILTRVIRIAIKNIKGNLNNLEKNHIYDIIDIQKKSTGKYIMLPSGIRVTNNYGDIYVYKEEKKHKVQKINKEVELNLLEENVLTNHKLKITLDIIKSKEDIKFDKNPLIKYFDYDKIKGVIKLRYRKNGDKFMPFGMSGSKKLKDLFIDLKIPKERRDSIPLITFGDDIAWIVGYRISDKFKINKDTKSILKIKIEREEE
ncbi:tRNA lysidine(34) synthetase TilS [Clostridium novyi]|uniref:tRNA(Ile)-lysidine synthase n=1 Tax=Clostridium novyi (strain NT) TaxID=386415 RepID=A0PXM6_CLONN|nr:tRNA lysidine(34) synthetase TilS [Clostridium novyi]ABK61498.1 Cell cycle protein MesJ, putative [Clostridium novyi NT]KEH87138.1 tRNA(Ile)-lysidine synthetase [Clostridium novyi A str. NCTC 538]KEH89835.1 tRNA(Ile)-lysidine synthetase [Clostridium novyi A str. 4540]